MPDFAVRMIPIADLRDHPRNSNRHGEHQLAVLEQRFRALGWYKNVVVAEWEGTTTLLAGHGVTRGAERAGETVAPCHVRPIDPLSPEALDILEGDNTVADLAEPDLHERLRNLVELDAAGRLGNVGYDDGALDRLKAELQAEDFAASQGPPVEDPGPSEPPTEPVSKLGDVWLCGKHRVVCGDCTEAGVWDALGEDKRAQVVVTSPPYGQQRDYELSSFVWDEVVPPGIALASTYLSNDGSLLVNLGLVHESGRVVEYWRPLFDLMEAAQRPLFGWYVWDKLNGLPGDWNGRLAPAHEFVFHFASKPRQAAKTVECKYAGQVTHAVNSRTGLRGAEGDVSRWTGGGEPTGSHKVPDSVLRCAPVKGHVVDHPAPYSPEFASMMIEPFAKPGDIVADPFLGSGTTLIAAEQLGRVCYGIEIEPRYVDVAVRRWQQATGQTAILESTGEPFPVVE